MIAEYIEQAKTDMFGHYFYISDPYIRDLRQSIVSVSKDGSLYCELLNNVFTNTNDEMKIV